MKHLLFLLAATFYGVKGMEHVDSIVNKTINGNREDLHNYVHGYMGEEVNEGRDTYFENSTSCKGETCSTYKKGCIGSNCKDNKEKHSWDYKI